MPLHNLHFMSNRLITTICRQRSTAFLLFLTLAMTACRPSKEAVVDYRFFEKNIDSLNKVVLNLKEPVIQKNDQLVINVSSASLDQTQTQVFNLLGLPLKISLMEKNALK